MLGRLPCYWQAGRRISESVRLLAAWLWCIACRSMHVGCATCAPCPPGTASCPGLGVPGWQACWASAGSALHCSLVARQPPGGADGRGAAGGQAHPTAGRRRRAVGEPGRAGRWAGACGWAGRAGSPHDNLAGGARERSSLPSPTDPRHARAASNAKPPTPASTSVSRGCCCGKPASSCGAIGPDLCRVWIIWWARGGCE